MERVFFLASPKPTNSIATGINIILPAIVDAQVFEGAPNANLAEITSISTRESGITPELVIIIEDDGLTSSSTYPSVATAHPVSVAVNPTVSTIIQATATNSVAPGLAVNPTAIPNTALPTLTPTDTPTFTSTPIPTTYYVDCQNGDDNNPGTTPVLAWMSLKHASTVSLNSGDNILLRRGCTWTEETLSIASNGLSGQEILISSYGTGALPVIFNSISTSHALELFGSYIIVEDIHAIANQTTFEANCDNNPVGFIVGLSFEPGSHNNIIQNSVAEGFYAGIAIDPGAYSNQVLNNQLIDNIMMSPLDLTPGNDAGAFGILVRGDDNEIAYNEISGSDACSYDYVRDGSAIEIYGGSNNIIHHNYATETDIFTELGNPASSNNSLYYNVFSSSLTESKFIVTRGNQISLGPIINTSVYNNTVYLTGTEAEGFVCHAGCNNNILTMYNNIFHVANYRVGFADAPFIEDNNLFYGGAVAGITPGSNTILADPLFVSAATEDFHLQASSPAINIGLDLGFTLDFDGIPVPVGPASEIGAYENPSAFNSFTTTSSD